MFSSYFNGSPHRNEKLNGWKTALYMADTASVPEDGYIRTKYCCIGNTRKLPVQLKFPAQRVIAPTGDSVLRT